MARDRRRKPLQFDPADIPDLEAHEEGARLRADELRVLGIEVPRMRTWLTGSDPQWMLNLMRKKAGDRKLRLFACACCRGVWHLLTDGRSRRAVEIAEQYADGLVDDRELSAAFAAAQEAFQEAERSQSDQADKRASFAACLTAERADVIAMIAGDVSNATAR